MSFRDLEGLARALVGKVDRVERKVRALENKSDLGFSSIENGASIEEYTVEGGLRASFGGQFDGTHVAASLNGPVPPQPTPAVCTGGITAVIKWDGLYVPDPLIVSPMDWSRVEIHASLDPAYTAETVATLRDTFETPRGGEKTVTLPAGTWYIRLVTRTFSGNRSAEASTVVAVTVEAPATNDGLIRKPGPLSGTAVPTLTAAKGSTYFRLDATGGVIENYEQTVDTGNGTGATWELRPFRSEVITSLDVGKLSAATLDITTGVADKFFANIFSTRKLTANQVYIGPGPNPIPDPPFLDAITSTGRKQRSTGGLTQWTEIAGTATSPKGMRTTTPAGGAIFQLWPITIASSNISSMIAVEAGDTWKMSVDVETDVSATVSWALKLARGDGTITDTLMATKSGGTAAGRRSLVAEYVIPAGVIAVTPHVQTTAAGVIWTVYGNPFMGLKTDGSLYVDGAINGTTVTGATLQTEAAADRGLKILSTGLMGYNTVGENTFSFTSATGKVKTTGRLRTGADAEAGSTLLPAIDSATGKTTGLFISATAAITGGLTGGVWQDDTAAGAQMLNLRGMNNGNVEVLGGPDSGGNLYIRKAASRVGNFANWALGDATNGNNYLPNLHVTGGYLRLGGAPTTSAASNAVIATSPEGVMYRSTSSLKNKADVIDWNPLNKALQLRPRSWVDRTPMDPANPFQRYYGYVAEEVAPVFPELVGYNRFGEPDSVMYERLPSPATVAALVIVGRELLDLKTRVAAMETRKPV